MDCQRKFEPSVKTSAGVQRFRKGWRQLLSSAERALRQESDRSRDWMCREGDIDKNIGDDKIRTGRLGITWSGSSIADGGHLSFMFLSPKCARSAGTWTAEEKTWKTKGSAGRQPECGGDVVDRCLGWSCLTSPGSFSSPLRSWPHAKNPGGLRAGHQAAANPTASSSCVGFSPALFAAPVFPTYAEPIHVPTGPNPAARGGCSAEEEPRDPGLVPVAGIGQFSSRISFSRAAFRSAMRAGSSSFCCM